MNLIVISATFNFIFFLLMFQIKEFFEVQPMNLIMYSILTESLGMMFYAMQSHITDFKLNEMFAKTIFSSTDIE